MMKKLLSLGNSFGRLKFLFLLLVVGSARGQVSAYGVAQSASAATVNISTGSTPIFTGAPSPGHIDSSVYDLDLASISGTPFQFNFNGVNYSHVYVSTNGFVFFGPSAAYSTYGTVVNPISGASSYAGAISAFGRDLVLNASTQTISYRVDTDANGRKLIIQWAALRYNGTASVTGTMRFQIHLYESAHLTESNSITVAFHPTS